MISLDRLITIIGVTDQADVPLIEDMRDAAIAFIESQTNRYFGPVTSHTEWLRGNGTRSLWLSASPILEDPLTITVTEYTHAGATGSVVVEDGSTGFSIRNHGTETELVRLGGGGVWTNGYDYAVTYSRGYADDQGPKDIEHVLIELVRNRYNSEGAEVMKSETIGGYSYTRFDAGDLGALPAADQAVIDAHRRLVFA